jgi:hypothetical protein
VGVLRRFELDVPPIAIETAQEFAQISPRHAETAIYFLHMLVPAGIDEFAIPMPNEHPFMVGQFLLCSAVHRYDIDPGLLEAALNADGHILPIMAAEAVLAWDRYHSFLGIAVQRLLGFVELFQNTAVDGLLELIRSLVRMDVEAFIEFVPIAVELFVMFRHIPEPYITVIEMLTLFLDNENVRMVAVEPVFALAVECFRNAEECEPGLDLLLAILETVDGFEVTPDIFEMAMRGFSSLAMAAGVAMTVFELAGFFARAGFHQQILEWYLHILANPEVESSCFCRMATIMLALFENCADDAVLSLFQAVLGRLNAKESHGFQGGFAVSVAAIVLTDTDRILAVLEAVGLSLSALVDCVDAVFSKGVIRYFDLKFIVAALFRLKDMPVFVYDDATTVGEVALTCLLKMIDRLAEGCESEGIGLEAADRGFGPGESDCFTRTDPFVRTVSRASLSEFLTAVLAGMEIPARFHPILAELQSKM